MHKNVCVELHSCKEMVEKAIETGSQQHCPYCQLTGLKDDGCTHMVCERCQHQSLGAIITAICAEHSSRLVSAC